jgi:hypothetical protein
MVTLLLIPCRNRQYSTICMKLEVITNANIFIIVFLILVLKAISRGFRIWISWKRDGKTSSLGMRASSKSAKGEEKKTFDFHTYISLSRIHFPCAYFSLIKVYRTVTLSRLYTRFMTLRVECTQNAIIMKVIPHE